jgi:hypothetical protein
MSAQHYRIATFRAAGLEAKWGRNQSGRPVIFARKPGGKTWWIVTAGCWARAKVVGLWEAFDEATLLGDIFSVPV